MAYCDTCGKKIEIKDGYRTIDANGNPIIICDECKQMMERKTSLPNINSEDKWFSSSSKNDNKFERPKDVKWVVIAQFIAFITSPAIFIPFFTSYIPNEIVILYGAIALVVLLLISIGLMSGEKWSLTVTRTLQFSFIISWLIVVMIFLLSGRPFGVQSVITASVPLVILGVLNKPSFKNFFKNKKTKFSRRSKIFLLFGTIFIIAFNLFPLSLFNLEMNENPWNFGSDINLDRGAAIEALIGIWENDNQTVKLQFNEDNTCTFFIDNMIYVGEWNFDNPIMNNNLYIKVFEENGSLFYSDWMLVNYENMQMKTENRFSESEFGIVLYKLKEKQLPIPISEGLAVIIVVIGLIDIILSYKKIREIIKMS